MSVVELPGKFACTVCGTCLRLRHVQGVLNVPEGPHLPLPLCSDCGGTVVALDDKAKVTFEQAQKNTKLLESLLDSDEL
jgi:hypothetical protein